MVVSAKGSYCPRRVRDGDPHGRRLRHGGSVALGGSAAIVQYSPARRTYFVRNDGVAGTRPVCAYAGQYADPTGMWSVGVGLVFGWDKSHGWNVGVESAPFSYSWNQDGSGSFNVGVHGNYQFYILNLGGSLGYSYNTYTGHALSADGTACIGVKEGDAGLCAGVKAGGGLHWDPHGNFLGATVYSGVFAEARLNEEASLKVHGGYEQGFLGMEGRGFYAGGDIGGLNAEWSRNGGWNYGWNHQFNMAKYSPESGWSATNTAKAIGGLFAVDMNGSMLNAGEQLLSRFTWELPQTLLGLTLAIGASESGLVDEVDYERGATLVRYGVDIGGAFTLSAYIAGNDLYATQKEQADNGLWGRPLLPHEYGHVIQSRIWGLLYIPFIALPSAINATFVSPREHMNLIIEQDATEKGHKYFD